VTTALGIGQQQAANTHDEKNDRLANGNFVFGKCFRGSGAAANKNTADRLLTGATPEGQAARVEAFRLGLRELGYVRGKTLSLNIDVPS
jgi:hypothetical protein